MIFEGLYCAFSCIDMMIVWFDELDVTAMCVCELFEDDTCLVVGDIETWGVPLFGECVKDCCECGEDCVV